MILLRWPFRPMGLLFFVIGLFSKYYVFILHGWMNVALCHFQRIIMLYQDSNLRKDEMKGEGSLRHVPWRRYSKIY